jgi:hypothetical protein
MGLDQDIEKRNREIERISRSHCEKEEVLYWQDDYMSPLARGSKTRIKPHPDMLLEHGHLALTKINGNESTVLFDRLYLDYYLSVNGLNFLVPTSEEESSHADLRKTVDNFLDVSNISLSESNPRHSLFVKFVNWIESND